MKAIITAITRKAHVALIVLLLLLVAVKETNAQPPDCVSGNVAYTVFNDSISSAYTGTIDSMEIRPVNLLTGAVGALMGGRRYWVRRWDGSGSSNSDYIYGSSALAVDFATSRFYVMTQMSNALPKDIITINPVGGAMTTIGTTPASLNGYHFVKMAAHSNGWIYAIGVNRDSTVAANLMNPIIRFQTCGLTPSAGCATASIQILGYLPTTGLMYKWLLFNGDIAFDVSGNMLFATAAYENVGGTGTGRYTDARLFRVNAADLPTSAGSGIIPMTLIADYNGLDSTVINGIGFNSTGSMFFTTRRYYGVQNTPLPPFGSELYSSSFPGTATQMPGFVRPTPGTSASDLATCYFPAAILSSTAVTLNAQYASGSTSLQWNVKANQAVLYYEVQRSSDGENFETIARIDRTNPDQNELVYRFNDAIGNDGNVKFYRIRQVMNNNSRIYSNIVKINPSRIHLAGKIKPNPVTTTVEVPVYLRTPAQVTVVLKDQGGRTVQQTRYNANAGNNSIRLNDLGKLTPGVYVVEVSTGDEIIREKIVKQ